jgi:hypothetical protein
MGKGNNSHKNDKKTKKQKQDKKSESKAGALPSPRRSARPIS